MDDFEYRVSRDALTGVLNRSGFDRHFIAKLTHENGLSDEVRGASSESSTTGIVIVFFDLDDFNQANEIFGHGYGDLILRAFARRLERATQIGLAPAAGSAPAPPLVGRYGGEEFTVALFGATLDEGHAFAEKLRADVAADALPNDAELSEFGRDHDFTDGILPEPAARGLTISAGVTFAEPSAIVADPPAGYRRLVNEADVAMYRAKVAGKNRVFRFSDLA